MSCGAGHTCNSDPTLLSLWYRPAAAALIQPLGWKLPYAAGAAIKKNLKIELLICEDLCLDAAAL